MAANDTLLNALIGAVVTVVLSWVPLSPVLGGAVAGYLEADDGLTVGAISGAIASIPLFGVLLLAVLFLPIAGGDPVFAAVGVVFVLVALVLALAYGVALGALGGVIGVYLHDEL